MAEGGGFGETDPLMEHTDDRNDEDDGDTTGTFDPGSASTPGRRERIPLRTTTMNRPPERGSHTAETSFIEGSGNLTREFQLQEAQNKIKYYFPEYNESIDLSINNRGKIIAKGPRGGDIEVFKSDKKSLLSTFINRFKTKLGLKREDILDKQKKEKGKWEKYIADQQKISKDTSKDSSERALAERNIKKAKEAIAKIDNRINDVENQILGQATRIPEAPTLQEFQQHEAERQKGKKKYDKRDKNKKKLQTTETCHKMKDSKLVKEFLN